MVKLRFQFEDRADRVGNLRRLQPAALPPDESVLTGLSIRERTRLRQLLSRPCEYVRHPSFRRLPELPDGCSAEFRPADAVVAVKACPATGTGGPGVLTAEQEYRLLYRFNYRRYRVFCLLRRHRGRRLGNRATRALLRWDRLAEEARAAIVDANISLVLAMASRTRDRRVELGELISEGNLALLRCVDRFDCSRGYKFSTYACRGILTSFSRARRKLERERAHYQTGHDLAVCSSEGLDVERECDEIEEVGELRRILFSNTAGLTAVERRVLDARFSLPLRGASGPARSSTLGEVGLLLGISGERVRQLQEQAIWKIRTMLEQRLAAAS